MPGIQEKVIEEIKLLPEDIMESVFNFVKYLRAQKRKIERFESKYGTFKDLENKIANGEHSWEEEKEFFEWEATLTEMEKLRKILKVEGED